MALDAQQTILLLNEVAAAFSNVTARIIAASELTEEELRAERDKLSAETHALIAGQLAKLPAPVPATKQLKKPQG